MQKFGTIAALALGAQAFKNSTPFQGEHANADIIEQENRTTHRQKRTGKSVNKYESIINKDVYKKHQLYGDMVWERIMGQSEEKAKFEKAMDSYKHAKEGKFGRGRLGVDY